MKEVFANVSLSDVTHTFIKIAVPKGWLQFMIVEHNEVRALAESNYHGLSIKERDDGFVPKPTSGGMLFLAKETNSVITSGAVEVPTRFVYKIGNLEVKESTDFWAYLHNNIGASDVTKVRLKYSDKELQEMV